MNKVQVIGSYLSPYVRKVLVCLDLKGVAYEIDPIVPFLGDDRFSALSPLRRIPVYVDDEITLCDSTIICEYLEQRHPEPRSTRRARPIAPRARWLEEFADSRMGEVFIWRLFNQVAIRPSVWGEAADPQVLQKTLSEEVPLVLDYLEAQLPAQGFLFGPVGMADVTIACFFRNAAFARFQVDAARWPVTAAFVARVLAIDSFEKLKPFEDKSRRTPIALHRAALAELGAPLTASSYGTDKPRRGVMRID